MPRPPRGVDAVLARQHASLDDMRRAVSMVAGRMMIASVGPDHARDGARGCRHRRRSLLSSGWLTHSVTALDIGLDYRGESASSSHSP